MPDLEPTGRALTIEMWIRQDVEAADPVLAERLADGVGYRLTLPRLVGLRFVLFRGRSGPDEITATPELGFAGYSHVAVVAGNGTIAIYREGKQISALPMLEPMPYARAPFVVGRSSAGSDPFYGSIDEVAIYDYPLSEEQIAAHVRLARP